MEQDPQALLFRIQQLEEENTKLRRLLLVSTNAILPELVALLQDKPQKIAYLSEHFGLEPRIISRYLFKIKREMRYDICTASDGSKFIPKNLTNSDD